MLATFDFLTLFCWFAWCMPFSLAYACEKSVCILGLCFCVHTIILILIFFFFSSRFFFLHAFFPKHMHTKKARGAHIRFNQCAAPKGRRLQKSTSKRWGGGFLTTCVFLILLGCLQRPKAHPRFTPPCLSGTADSWDFYMIFLAEKHGGTNLIGTYFFKKWVWWWAHRGFLYEIFGRKSMGEELL